MPTVECGDCGTTFDTERDATGSSDRCPYCGNEAEVVDESVGTRVETVGGTTVRVTVEVLPSE